MLSEVYKEIVSHSPEETISLGMEIAEGRTEGDILCLKGPLGAGKTHFVKGLAAGFGIGKNRIQSPTYTLINEYDGRLPLYHFDCYRMESPREALEIGAEEYFYDTGVCIIEWPDRIIELIPPEALWISFSIVDKETRKIVIGKRNL